MADLPMPERYRMTQITDLRRVVEPFSVDELAIRSGDRISIASQAEGANVFLDGNVYAAAVNLVPSRLAPFTGTRWQIRLNDDATWSFLNQGHAEQMLAGSASIVTLGRAASLNRFDTTRWLMYRDLTGIRLRPCMRTGGWLAVRGGAAVLAQHDAPVGRSHYWTITPYAAGE